MIVRSVFGNDGKVVDVVKLYQDGKGIPAWGVICKSLNMPHYTEANKRWCEARGVDALICDSLLRPIRAQPGADETLTWKVVPSTDKVTS